MKKRFLMISALVLYVSSAFSQVIPFTEEEMNVAKEHPSELSLLAHVSAADAFSELQVKYGVWHEYRDYLSRLCEEREFRKHIYDFIEKDPVKRFKKKQEIDYLYQDSIDVRMLPFTDKLAGECIQRSLYIFYIHKQTDSIQYRNIMDTGLSIAKKLREDPRFNYDAIVMDCLKKNLTKTQLNAVLTLKNMPMAKKKTNDLWQKLQTEGLTEKLDSAEERGNVIAYFIHEMNIHDMYGDNEKLLKNNLSELWKQQPLSVRLYESSRQKELLANKKKEKTINSNLLW
ncbi:MAG: hypothetical protein K5874_10635 [Bacteroidaceae bacterium]|nr:hypothetical protein [Bacteroidaceae bacterium]